MREEETGAKYTLLGELGGGAFGVVYLARKQPLGSLVAIKVIRPEVEAMVLDRLWDEARLLAAVRHPNIVAIDDLVTLDDGRPGLVTEYVEGADLQELLEGDLPWTLVVEVVRGVAAALDAGWVTIGPEGSPLRIVHRDVKPENVRVGRNGEVKLLDFGIARGELPDRAGTWRLAGTLRYMAPERYRLESPHTSDVFSLACVLWRGVTGQGFYPTAWADPQDYLPCVRDPARFAALLDPLDEAPVPPALRELLRDALAWDPEARPSARDFGERCRAIVPENGLRAWCQRQWPDPAPLIPPLSPVADQASLAPLSTASWPREDSVTAEPTTPAPLVPQAPEPVAPAVPRALVLLGLAGLAMGIAPVVLIIGLGLAAGLSAVRAPAPPAPAPAPEAPLLRAVAGQLVDALTGGPVPGLKRVRAIALDSPAACRAVVGGDLDPSGAFRLDGLCADASYRIEPDLPELWLESAEIAPDADNVRIAAWHLPAIPGVYRLAADTGALQPVAATEMRSAWILPSGPELAFEQAVSFPAQVALPLPVIGPDDFLVLAGEGGTLSPLVGSGERWFGREQRSLRLEGWRVRPWVYVGTKFSSDDRFERVEREPDPPATALPPGAGVPASYLSGRALPEGSYAVHLGGRTHLVDLGAPQRWRWGDAPEMIPETWFERSSRHIERLIGPLPRP